MGSGEEILVLNVRNDPLERSFMIKNHKGVSWEIMGSESSPLNEWHQRWKYYEVTRKKQKKKVGDHGQFVWGRYLREQFDWSKDEKTDYVKKYEKETFIVFKWIWSNSSFVWNSIFISKGDLRTLSLMLDRNIRNLFSDIDSNKKKQKDLDTRG